MPPTAAVEAKLEARTSVEAVAGVLDPRVGENLTDKVVPTGIAWLGLIVTVAIPLLQDLGAQGLLTLSPGVQATLGLLTAVYVSFHARGRLHA